MVEIGGVDDEEFIVIVIRAAMRFALRVHLCQRARIKRSSPDEDM